MRAAISPSRPAVDTLDDTALLALARDGGEAAVRALVQRHNRRLFRVARGVVRDDAEAEDIVQEAWVRAFTGLDGFRGDALLSTWLTRIALNEALGRLRRRRPTVQLAERDADAPPVGGGLIMFPSPPTPPGPEAETARGQVRRFLEEAVDGLPEDFRIVFILRDIEGLSTEETATHLAIRVETVKTRLHRARKLMRRAVEAQLAPTFTELFPFGGARCVHMAEEVLQRLRARDDAR